MNSVIDFAGATCQHNTACLHGGGGPASLLARHSAAVFDIDREVLSRREQLEERKREREKGRENERSGPEGVSTAAGGCTRCVQLGTGRG